MFSNPTIAKVDIRMIDLNNYDREPSFECSYDLYGLSMTEFQRHINNLIREVR